MKKIFKIFGETYFQILEKVIFRFLMEIIFKLSRGKYRIPFYMSTDCENLLKRFLVLNPMKRGVLTNIMNDKWININYEQDNLTPYKEPDLFNALAEDRVG